MKALIVALVLAAVAASPAFALRGGDQANFTVTPANPVYGDTVTFNVNGGKATDSVLVQCYDPLTNEFVYDETHPYGTPFVLSGWGGQAVECGAWYVSPAFKTKKYLAFSVAP